MSNTFTGNGSLVRNGIIFGGGGSSGDTTEYMTQSEYEQITPVQDQLYGVSGANPINAIVVNDASNNTYQAWSGNKVNTQLGLKADKTQITNPNLLDNPWFTVNQRGFASGSYNNETKYTVDRWKVQYGIGSVSLGSNGLTIEPTSSGNTFLFRQQLDIASLMPYILGKTVTLSIMLSDGSVYSATDTLPASLTSSYEYKCFVRPTGDNVNVVVLQMSSTDCCVQYYNDNGALPTSVITLRAVKLELGSISTLALDTAPNYATELLKCQRYFQRHSFAPNNIMTLGAINPNLNVIWGMFYFATPMRTIPSAVLPSASDLKVYLATSWSVLNPTGIQLNQVTNELGTLYISLASSYTAGTFAILQALNATQIDLTADL